MADFVLSFLLVFWEKASLAVEQEEGLAFQVRGLDAEWRVLTFLLSEGLGFELNIFWIIFCESFFSAYFEEALCSERK